MLTLPLRIAYSRQPGGQAVAWLLPGDDPRKWLEELAAAGLATLATRLYPVPGETADRLRGVLVAPGAGAAFSPAPARWQPYTRLTGRLYLPVQAVLEPAMEESELAALLADDCTYLFHPVAGLVAFETARALRTSDLLLVPPQADVDWNHAQPGIGFVKRLLAVEPEQTFDLSTLLAMSQDDIGSEPLNPETLPKSPLEPDEAMVSKLLAGGKLALAALLRQLTKLSPRTASQPTWVNALEAWANKVRQARSQDLAAIRNREILRLLQLLESDPDKGLRFALPLAGDPHRGRSTPTARLGERNVAYQGIQFGGSADLWDIQERYRQQLHQRYRQLATRELQLGRYRRAAYILADLLGDFAAAASALEQGRLFREAAVIYRERLKRPLEEANCLERGGLLTEAIACYAELQQWEKVGDLYTRIEQLDQAAEAFERAVSHWHVAGDHFKAAGLLEQKLSASDRAADELWGAWPDAKQATQCLKSYFGLLSRRGLHDLALSRVRELSAQKLEINSTVAMVEQLASLATGYPRPEVQALAADRARVTIAGVLKDAGEQRRRLIQALGQLEPADRLLNRDCQRFLTLSEARPVVQVARPARPTNQCHLVHEFQLPAEVRWRSLVSAGDSFIAAGYRDRELVVLRGRWNGVIQQPSFMPWRVDARMVDLPIYLEPDRAAASQVYLHVPGCEPFKIARVFPESDGRGALAVKSHPALTRHALATSCCPGGPFWQLTLQYQRVVLSQHRHDGQLVSTRDITDQDSLGEGNWALLARHQRIYVATDHVLHLVGGHAPTQIELTDPVRRLSGSAVHTRPRIAATFDRGGVVLWDDEAQRTQAFGKELESPLATFTQHGWLVVAARKECHVYLTRDGKLTFTAMGPGSASGPIAVMATDHAHQYAICDGEGRVAIYRIPSNGVT